MFSTGEKSWTFPVWLQLLFPRLDRRACLAPAREPEVAVCERPVQRSSGHADEVPWGRKPLLHLGKLQMRGEYEEFLEMD